MCQSVVIAAVMVTLGRPFAARLRKTANKLWPWDGKELAACDVDPVTDELRDTSSVRTDCMKQNSLQTLPVV